MSLNKDKRISLVQECIDGKWKQLLNGEMPLHKATIASNCKLCTIYGKCGCSDCPVRSYTGIKHCIRTPVYELAEFNRNAKDKYELNCELAVCVQWEIDFLNKVKLNEIRRN